MSAPVAGGVCAENWRCAKFAVQGGLSRPHGPCAFCTALTGGGAILMRGRAAIGGPGWRLSAAHAGLQKGAEQGAGERQTRAPFARGGNRGGKGEMRVEAEEQPIARADRLARMCDVAFPA